MTVWSGINIKFQPFKEILYILFRRYIIEHDRFKILSRTKQ